MEEYFYKQLDEQGNVIAVLTCSMHLEESESQIEITEEEYNQLIEDMQEEVIEDEELSDLPV